MKNKKKLKLGDTPSTIISFRYASIALIITLILMFLIPVILNYGPETINTPFDIQMSYISYTMQFLILTCIIIIAIVALTKVLLKDIDDWYKSPDKYKYSNPKKVIQVRKKCFNLPYLFYIFEVTVPSLSAFIVLSITGSHYPIMIAKIVLLLLSFTILLAIVSFIFSKDLYDQILEKTYIEGADIGFRVSLRKRIFIIIYPIFLSAIILTGLAGYSASVREKEDVLFESYTRLLTDNFDENKTYSKQEIYDIASNLNMYHDTDTVFILNPEYESDVLKGKEVSYFIVEYIKQIADSYEGRLYDSYGIDTQGSSIKLKTDEGYYYVGILYDVVSNTAFKFFALDMIFLAVIIWMIITIFAGSLSRSLNQIIDGFRNICDNSDTETLLPVISNDEIGDLVKSFNEIQKLNTNQIADIQNKQNMLIERERLASLGQMVGGIAHSLKTPIFSISGGVEGLTDLVNEFDSSIEDPEVNDEDMHEIAKDMNVWIQKIKTQLSYMSEVITTVKGQAANLSGDDTVEFTINEVFSHINILMKHEFQSALVTLNINNKVDDNIILKGNINSLIQVLNNLLSNAIQAYNKVPDKSIDLSAKIENNNVLISVKDYGPGIPNSVKDRLFKEMITTKGKEGTGLGVFMSYSMIKAKFNGDIKFETSKNGTEFVIYLPINR